MSEESAKKGQNMTPRIKKLGDICQIKPPKKIAKEKLSETDLVSFFPMADLETFNYYISPKSTKKLSEVYSGYVFFEDNDVLLAKITPCFENGKLGIAKNLINGIGFGSSEYHVFRTSEESIPEYIYYFLSLNNIREEGKGRMTGAVGHKRIPNDYLLDLDILVPSISEQKQIVSILDKAFAAIDKAKANAEQNLQNAKELFESYLQNIFENKGDDWEEKTLGEVTSKIGSGATPKGGKSSYKEEGISLIRSMNVHDFHFKEKNLAFIDEQQAKALANVTIREEDVLLNITGASIARCCIVPKKYLPARVNQHVSIIRAKKEMINPDFLASLLTSKFFKQQILDIGEQGATRQAITKAQLENFVIAFPEKIVEQEKVVQTINLLKTETKKLQSIYTQKIAELEELKKSILQQAFSGQLTTN